MNSPIQLRKVQAIHQETAEKTLDRRQKVFILLLAAVTLTTGFFWSIEVGKALVATITVIYSAVVILKLYLIVVPYLSKEKPTQEFPLPDTLPTITVLGAHYKEGSVLARWVRNIDRLDWPKEKLEVLLLIRENDLQTIQALVKIKLSENFRVIWLKPADYGSKPAALNVGIEHARGSLVAVYDSENGPNTDQLKKQVAALANSPENVAFAQSYPVVSNWRTKHWWQSIFPKIEAAEYSSYYNVVNRRLVERGLFSPLPGNSILFKKDALLAVGKYDRHNKTEDAEIAVKLARRKWRGIFVDSQTTEESPSSYRDFQGRRRRWTHGFIQTYLVPMRHPIQLLKELGPVNFMLFQLTIGGSVFVQLLNPILWGMSIGYWVSLSVGWEPGVTLIRELYPWPVMYLAVVTTILGVLIISFYSIVDGVMKREMYENMWVAYMFLPYNVLISFASYLALYDLIRKAEWHKTEHENLEEDPAEIVVQPAVSAEAVS